MNNEPIQFLPVAPFWRKSELARRKTQRVLCWGIVLGSVITTAVAITIILL